jgi:hypothetical protein
MNIINCKAKTSEPGLLRRAVVVLAGVALVTLPATTIFAHTPEEEDIAKYEVEEQVSANAARRLARVHLCSLGFCSRFGPGGAKIRSITRDAGTWIIYARVSNGPAVMNQQRILYVDARTGLVSNVPPDSSPAQVAAE